MTRRDHHPHDPIRIPIEDSIDLHTFSPKEIPSLLEEYLGQCIKVGIYEVRIIHGKGVGYQRLPPQVGGALPSPFCAGDELDFH
jgi:dsDNA-specific endonuclease/ATPase MutS2